MKKERIHIKGKAELNVHIVFEEGNLRIVVNLNMDSFVAYLLNVSSAK